MKKLLGTMALMGALGAGSMASAQNLSLAYFMGPKHPMNAGVFTPFAEKLAEVSGGELSVQMFPGGALNAVPPKQYAILLDGVADIVFALPGYTGDVFPKTQVVGMPDVCASATACTEALLNARSELEREYNAKILAIWANAPPVLLNGRFGRYDPACDKQGRHSVCGSTRCICGCSASKCDQPEPHQWGY